MKLMLKLAMKMPMYSRIVMMSKCVSSYGQFAFLRIYSSSLAVLSKWSRASFLLAS